MGLIPGYKHDIFVSFAHADDLGSSSDHPEDGWVGATINELRSYLSSALKSEIEGTGRELDIFWSNQVGKDKPLKEELRHEVDNSALLLVIMSKHFLRSKWCVEVEFSGFAESIETRSDTLFNINSPLDMWPILVVSVGPTPREEWPQIINDVPGFDFYNITRTQQGPDPRYNWPSPHKTDVDNNEYFRELAKLVWKFRERIVRAMPNEDPPPPPPPSPEKEQSVLLLATKDMMSDQGELAAFCVAKGYHVENADTVTKEINQTEIVEVIDRGGIVVLMFGYVQPNDYLIGSFENACQIGKEHTDCVLFWTKPNYLSMVEQQPSETFGAYQRVLSNLSAEVMNVPMPDLQSDVVNALSTFNSDGKSGRPGRKTLVRLYIDTDPDDRSVAERFAEHVKGDEVRKQLRSRGINVFTWLPSTSGDQAQINRRFEECVPKSEGVIIVHGRTSEEAIQYKIEDILEIEAMRETDNTREISVAMLLGPPHNELSFAGDFEVIEQASWDQLNVTSTVNFISQLAERKAGNLPAVNG